MSLRFFLGLAVDELHDVRMPHLQRLHLGRSARLATALDHRRNLVVDPHEGERTGGLASPRQLFAVGTQRR